MADVKSLKYIQIEEIEKAKKRIKGLVTRTPLIELDVADLVPDKRRVFLKLENLQEPGAYKVRGAGNAVKALIEEEGSNIFESGVLTSSSGNFALGLSHVCKKLGVPCTVIIPNTAPDIKVNAIQRNGAKIVYVSYNTWWHIVVTHDYTCVKGDHGRFIHPTCDRNVIAGAGTIGLEIMEDLDHVDLLISPWGSGSLSTGVGSVLHEICPSCKVYACEVNCACPLITSFQAGKPSWALNHQESFVDGMGGKSVFEEMWSLATNIITDSIPLPLETICRAIRLLLERRHIVAEGAGAAPLAVALGWHDNNEIDLKDKNIVCLVSGGNISSKVLAQILNGHTP